MLRIAATACRTIHSQSKVVANSASHHRLFNQSAVCNGRPRQYADHSRYPQPRSVRPRTPATLSNNELMDSVNEMPQKGQDMIDKIRITDAEVGKIYDSIMCTEERQERDQQSLRHKSRAEFLAMRRESREKLRQPLVTLEDGKDKEKPTPKKTDKEIAVKKPSGLESMVDQLVYVDTRVLREMERAKMAVAASVDLASVDKLEDRISAASVTLETASPTSSFSPELTLAEFNHVIYANMLGGRAEEAMRTYELMRGSGIKPNQRTFANLTMAYAKAGNLDEAVAMFKKLEEEDLTPDVYSYGTLIRAYSEFDRVDDAFRVYEMMKQREVWPNLPVYNSLIVACLRIGDLKRAWGVFEHLRYTIANPDEISYSIMIHACAKNGEVEKAMNLLDEMIENRLVLSDVTFNTLIHACSVRPDYFDEAFRLLQLMETHGFQPDFYTYNTLIYACARKKNLGLARDIFRDMLDRSLRSQHQDLIKIDSATIANMMWTYASYLIPVKTCSWKVAQIYGNLAVETMTAVKEGSSDSGDVSSCSRLLQSLTMNESKIHTAIATARLIDAQTRAAEEARKLLGTRDEHNVPPVPGEEPDKRVLDLVKTLLPEEVPQAHNSIGSEASRLMAFYLDVLKGNVTSHLLNAYLSALINNGRFQEAWQTILRDFDKFKVPKDGWTFQRMIRLCARTRDVPNAWKVWDEFKAWRAQVEKKIGTPGHENLKESYTTKLYRQSDTKEEAISATEARGDEAALNRASQEMLALSEALVLTGENAMPANVAGGSAAVIPSDREIARKQVGCGMETEHAVYIEMITLLGSCGDFRSAVQLLREEKNGVLEHSHKPTMDDVNSLYQNAVMAGDKHTALDIRGLCMQKPAHQARRALHRKWGTSFSWDLTNSQHKAMSRRLPESYRRHQKPFRDGEFVETVKAKRSVT